VNLIRTYRRELCEAVRDRWNYFWFRPEDPATLGLIRIAAGSMLFYTHLIWTKDAAAFFGADAWLSREWASTYYNNSPFAWTYFWEVSSPLVLSMANIVALVVLGLYTVGLWTRATSILAFIITVSYVHRVPGALFGLDQINGLLALYLMLGPSGAAYSLDQLIRRRHNQLYRSVSPSIRANVAIRLIQVHMCVIYLFAGMGKLAGESWWDGTALWGALANYEYQSIDVTWLAEWPLTINVMTHLTLFWELSYCVLVWHRLTRPMVLVLAIPLHLGIAICMGMITFGLIMLVGNLAFVSPTLVRAIIDRKRSSKVEDGTSAKMPGRGGRVLKAG